jgi:hypothetical protein
MDTLALSLDWDLVIDSNRNMALARNGQAISQDVASALKTFQGEVFYDETLGIPYYASILAQRYRPGLMNSFFAKEALKVPEVLSSSARVENFDRITRRYSGKVLVTTNAGVNLEVIV